jgi:hypothetical protein
MSRKQINNGGQAFALGATWGTPSVDNTMTSDFVQLINNTGLTLFTGDIVTLDPTGTMVNQATTATLSLGIGCVGSSQEFGAYTSVENVNSSNVSNTFPTIVGSTAGTGIGAVATDGNVQPFTNPAWNSVLVGFTNGSSAATSAQVSTINPFLVGSLIYTPFNAGTNANPQIFIITVAGGSSGAWTATVTAAPGSGFSNTFQGTTGSFTCQIGRDWDTKGPGWTPPIGWSTTSAFAPGAVVPIVTHGFARINVNGIATVNAGDLLTPTNNSFVATRIAVSSAVAANIGNILAVALEAQTQKDTTLTSIGISGHDSIRCYIDNR